MMDGEEPNKSVAGAAAIPASHSHELHSLLQYKIRIPSSKYNFAVSGHYKAKTVSIKFKYLKQTDFVSMMSHLKHNMHMTKRCNRISAHVQL